jgi:hypothetical protein
MRKKTAFLVLALSCFLVLTFALCAFADDWVFLGKRTVALGYDHDEIWVGSGEGTLKAIKLRVIDQGVQFDRLLIVLRNGRTIEEWIRDFIPAGGETRAIDLPGRERVVTKVIMYYTTRPGTLDRAEVELWGLRD